MITASTIGPKPETILQPSLPHPLLPDLTTLASVTADRHGFEMVSVQVLTHLQPMTLQIQIRRSNGEDVSTLTTEHGGVGDCVLGEGIYVLVAVEEDTAQVDVGTGVDRVSTLTTFDGASRNNVGVVGEGNGISSLLAADIEIVSILEENRIDPRGTDVRGGVGSAGALNGGKCQGWIRKREGQ